MRDPAVGPLGTKETQQFHRSTLRRNMQLAERDKGRIPAPLMGIQAAGWDCGMTVPVLDEAPDGVARQLIMIKVGRRWCGAGHDHASCRIRRIEVGRTSSTSPERRHS